MIAVVVTAAGITTGSIAVGGFTRAGNVGQYYQAQFGPAVLWACGRGFVNPPAPKLLSSDSPASLQANIHTPGFEPLGAFLGQQRESLHCSELPRSFEAEPPRSFQAGHRYLLMLAGVVWKLSGVSWPALHVLGPMFAGATAACIYLLARTGMGRLLALVVTAVWITSPLQLTQLPHLRDYAKAPFFMFSLCAIAWIALTRASRAHTVVALAVFGAVLGLGFGFRTDVASYLPLVVVAVLLFRPGLERGDVITRGFAAAAAIGGFLVVALPIIRAYQTGDNLAHVAVLGLSDPSHDWLRLREAPYSYGYLYHDGYMATVIAGYTERLTNVTGPLLLGTPDYAKWGNDYYLLLIGTFPGDMLVRAWAAVLAVFELPFEQLNILRPPWIAASFNWIFEYRGELLAWLHEIPPFLTMTILAVGIGTVSLRLCVLYMLFMVIMPGMTSLQFQGRHVFHLEILSILAYGCVLQFVWQLLRRRESLDGALIRATLTRALLVALVLAIFVTTPVAAARAYQTRAVTKLFTTYESAEVESVGSSVLQGGDFVTVQLPFAVNEQKPHYVDTNVLSLQVSGDRCDADTVSLKLRYQAQAPFGDYTRQTMVQVPPAGGGTTRLIFPVYTLGARSMVRDSLRFVGVEVPARQLSCIQSIGRFKEPDRFPLLLESLLPPDWRQRALYETLRDVEPLPADWRAENYSVPEWFQPGRSWLNRLTPESATPTFRSPQVRQLNQHDIEIRGRAEALSGYLLTWPYAARAKGSVFVVEGRLLDGGLTVGLQQNEQWAHQVNVLRRGRFRVAIRVDEPGSYGAVLASHQFYAGVTIDRYGWLPPEQ